MNFANTFLRENKQSIRLATSVLAIISCCVTGFVLAYSSNSANLHLIFWLFFVDILSLLAVGLFIFEIIRRVLRLQYKRYAGSRFHRQVIALFSCVVTVPPACVLIFAVLILNIGVDNLFKTPVKNSVDSAGRVASIYVNSARATMESFVGGVGEMISECIDGFLMDSRRMSDILSEETSQMRIEAIVLRMSRDQQSIVACSPFSLSLQLEPIPNHIIFARDGNVLSWESETSVFAAKVVNRDLGIYLVASTEIDKTILDHKNKIKTAIKEYTNISMQSAGLKLTFLAFFLTISIILLLASVLAGLIFANWILKPVNKLIEAVKNIESGNYKTFIKSEKFNNEWDRLILAFNDMTTKLESQRQQLIISQKQNTWRDIARKIAHEIKNPLTPIQLSAERLKSRYQKEISTSPEIFDSCINTIIRQVNCIKNLVKEFSDFARMPAPKIARADMVAVIRDSVVSYAMAYKNIAFHHSYEVAEFLCFFDQMQINQAIINVLQNGVNAISENNTRRLNGFIGNISIGFYTEGDTMSVIIEDDGPGFSEESIGKAMEPYYTTRKSGNGLGLAIVHKIIGDHGGDVTLGVSECLSGAKIAISIPCIYSTVDYEDT
jgi:two-component system nitrogen regulation sensor histidine kinase NtrY